MKRIGTAALAALIAASTAACVHRSLGFGDEARGASGATDAGQAGTNADLAGPRPDLAISCDQVRADFERDIKPLLIKECGVCHATAGGSYPGLFNDPDLYTYLTSRPKLVGPTPETSGIYNTDLIPCPGAAYTDPAALPVIGAWIVEYNLACSP